MPTNSYNDYARRWATRQRSGQNIAHEYLEKPAMFALLPDLKDKRVLCIGCGTGEECHHLLKYGPDKIVGIDISHELIELAKEEYSGTVIEYHVMDMEHLNYQDNSFDFVYSSLTIHYVESWGRVIKEVKRVLRSGGLFLFSSHHPVKWGAQVDRNDNTKTFLMGYTKHLRENKWKIYGDYLTTRKISDVWFNELDVSYYHRPFSLILKDIIQSGFEIVDFVEPTSTDAAKDVDLAFWEIHQKIPTFMIFLLRKN